MDVAETRFGTRARCRDELGLQVQDVFKRFLEEYSAESQPAQGDESSQMNVDHDSTREDVTNDSFSSARSRDAPRAEQSAKPVKSKYSDEALLLLNEERNTLFIDFKDIELFDSSLAEDIVCDYFRFYPFLCRAVATYAREEKIRRAEAMMDPEAEVASRMLEREQIKKQLDTPGIKNKNYYVGFYNYAGRDNIRDLTSTKIGTLTRVLGQVVRTHAVHPELTIGCFKCVDCLSTQYCEQEFRYTQPTVCSNDNCNNRTRWQLVLNRCRFTDFQRIRIQETQQELPRGCIPRSFDVVIRGADQMECIQPGDMCDFIGCLIVVPDVGQMMSGVFGTVSKELAPDSGVTGLKSIGVKEMTHTLSFLSHACILDGQTKPLLNTDNAHRESAVGSKLDVNDFSPEEIAKIEKMSKDNRLLDNLSQSLFSSIHGNDDVKRGILLQLLGGVPKQTGTSTKLRGDINVCLVGDPSTAKSQLLKVVTDFAPIKAVYASGKASTAAGLTAAVIRDNDGGFVIEAGALMLADRGICCIDEFDKMDLKDQVAIHEAMEQQTISITKAGVSATLNARASILAAANPIGGTYNTAKDLRANLSFSLPIMSRFDLFFTLIDPRDEDNDRAIAEKILDMHLNYDQVAVHQKKMTYSFEDIRLYLRFARKYYPKVPLEVENTFIREYVRIRSGSEQARTSWRITVRQFESLIRLSEAIARGHCDPYVKPEYVQMAAKLIEKTIVHVGGDEIDLSEMNKETQVQQTGAGGDEPTSQGRYEGEVESQRLTQTQTITEKRKISLAEYKLMGQTFILKLRREADNEDRESPMRRSELLEWYLKECVSEIASEDELIKKKLLCDLVLDRLIKKDNVIIQLRDDGLFIDTAQSQEDQSEQDRMLIVNPEFDETVGELQIS